MPTRHELARKKYRLSKPCPKPIAIPIVFVPGMMGSKLMQEDGENIWNPPTVGWVTQWGMMDGDERRALMTGRPQDEFSPDFLQVDHGDDEYMEDIVGENNAEEKQNRGWGGVVWGFYGEILNWLDSRLVNTLPDFTVGCSNIHFEVWAHPYNWTDDNTNAAKDLKKVVQKAHQETIEKYKDIADIKILKPIVITHSMGGLVARYFSVKEGGQDLVHTVIHGAMPTHGSPAAYKRMRAGFWANYKWSPLHNLKAEVGQEALGNDASQVTPMLANSPGGLQLLPNQYHQSVDGSKDWLKVSFADKGDIQSLPKAGDPYKEIYRDRTSWWRLTDPAFVNPRHNNVDESWGWYKDNLALAKRFHEKLGETGFHKPTKMSYCASEENLCWDEVEWKVESTIAKEDKAAAKQLLSDSDLPFRDNGQGDLEFLLRRRKSGRGAPIFDTFDVNLQAAQAAGDGTVHTGSGLHIKGLDLGVLESEPTTESDKSDEFESYTHDASYDSNRVRTQVAKWISEIIVEESKA